MRISDWSSDVCSSDLWVAAAGDIADRLLADRPGAHRLEIWPFRNAAARFPGSRRLHPGGGLGQRRRAADSCCGAGDRRSEEHTSELQSLMRISYAVF